MAEEIFCSGAVVLVVDASVGVTDQDAAIVKRRLDELGYGADFWVHDLPGGAPRLSRPAGGYPCRNDRARSCAG